MKKRSFAQASGTFKRIKGAAMKQRATVTRRRTQSSVSAAATALRRMIEVKGVDTGLGSIGNVPAADGTNAGALALNLVQQGAGSWNRIGRKINMKSLRLLITLEHSMVILGGQQFCNLVRMIVVYDRQPNSAAIPRFDDIFAATDQTGTESTLQAFPPRFDTMDRYRILRDKTIEFDGMPVVAGGTTTSNVVRQYKKVEEYIPLNGLETVFSGQSNPLTTADVSTGTLLIFFRAEFNQGETVINVQGNSVARLRYVDV